MADVQKFQEIDVEGGQELLPGLLDHITVHHIASKMTWETRNVMEMVNRKWKHAICNRSVYDACVFSQFTEAFLVLASFEEWKKPVLILYSCKNGTSLHLPPIPVKWRIRSFDCICLDGRLYVWVPAGSNTSLRGRTFLWVLDLAGDRRWSVHGRVRSSPSIFSYGVLGGKIYRFRGNTRPRGLSVLEGRGTDIRQQNELSIPLKAKRLPETHVYDPQSMIRSMITLEVDVERHLTNFCESEEQLQTGSPFWPYEPFYSEWRSRRSTSLASEKDYCGRNAMAPQVYHKPSEKLHLFFIGERLVRLVEPKHNLRHLGVDLQTFNTQNDSWEQWQSFPPLAPCRGGASAFADDFLCGSSICTSPLADDFCGGSIYTSAFADNFIWTLVREPFKAWRRGGCGAVLARSSPILGGEVNGCAAGWTYTTCSVGISPSRSDLVRPIYL